MAPVTMNILLFLLLGFSGFCLFLFWPLRIKWLLRRYAHYLYRRWSFYSQCLLSLWPLAQAVLFLLYKQNATRIMLSEYALGCFILQIFLLAHDMFAVNAMELYTEASLEEVDNAKKVYPVFRSFLMLIPAANIFFILQFSGWVSPANHEIELWVFSLLFVSGCILNLFILRLENWIVERSRARLELATADIQN